jgi:hypothetical protein
LRSTINVLRKILSKKNKTAGNVVRVGDKRNSHGVLVGKPEQENFDILGRRGGNKMKFDSLVNGITGGGQTCCN